MPDLHFTPELANATLPLLRAIVADLVEVERRLGELSAIYRELKARADRPQIKLNEARTEIARLVEERDACENELEEIGVQLGDAARGICDFPSELDGEPVYLCWELGEDAVEHYHGRDEGFAERRGLPVPCGAPA